MHMVGDVTAFLQLEEQEAQFAKGGPYRSSWLLDIYWQEIIEDPNSFVL